MRFASIDDVESALAGASYRPDRGLSTALYPALQLEKPLLPEGEAGVGTTEAAKATAQKPHGLAETIDWAHALTALGERELDAENVQTRLGPRDGRPLKTAPGRIDAEV